MAEPDPDITDDASLDELIARFYDPDADASTADALTARLRHDPRARTRLLTLSRLGVLLHETALAPAAAWDKPDPSPPRAKVRVPGVRRFAYALAACLALAAAVVVYVVVSSTPSSDLRVPSSSVATVIDTDGRGTLIVDNDIATPGQLIGAGDVYLDTGSAEFRLHNGVSVHLRSGARLTVHDPMRLTLLEGFAQFDCPHSAAGFAVDVPGGARVVDRGTGFTVYVRRDGRSVVRVTEGRVRIEHAATATAREATVGDAVEITATGLAAIEGPLTIARSRVFHEAQPPRGESNEQAAIIDGARVRLAYLGATWPQGGFYDLATYTLSPLRYDTAADGGAFVAPSNPTGRVAAVTASGFRFIPAVTDTLGVVYHAAPGRPRVRVEGSLVSIGVVDTTDPTGPEDQNFYWALFHCPDGDARRAVLLDSGNFQVRAGDGTITGDATIDGVEADVVGDDYVALFVFGGRVSRTCTVGDGGIVYTADAPADHEQLGKPTPRDTSGTPNPLRSAPRTKENLE